MTLVMIGVKDPMRSRVVRLILSGGRESMSWETARSVWCG